MASPLGGYAKDKEARRKAAIKGIGGLAGDIVGLIPGTGPAGAGIKRVAGLMSGDDEMSSTPMPKEDKKKDRTKEVDAILDGMKNRKQRTQVDINKDRASLSSKRAELDTLRKSRNVERSKEGLVLDEEEEKRKRELTNR